MSYVIVYSKKNQVLSVNNNWIDNNNRFLRDFRLFPDMKKAKEQKKILLSENKNFTNNNLKIFKKRNVGVCLERIFYFDLNSFKERFNLLDKSIKYDDFKIILNKDNRCKVFEKDNFECVCCGMKASKVWIEKFKTHKHWKVRFYGTKDDKEDVLTIDHIIPISKGGSFGSIKNKQTMCSFCNSMKGNSLPI
jgi:hypothetical protein